VLPLQIPLALLLAQAQLLVLLLLQLLLVELQLHGLQDAEEQDQEHRVEAQRAQKWRHLSSGKDFFVPRYRSAQVAIVYC